MVRVFIAGSDESFCKLLRDFIKSDSKVSVCGEAKNGIEAINMAVELVPDLIVLEMRLPPIEEFHVAEVIKTVLPEIPLFLMTKENGVDIEKEASAQGTDAVFERGEELSLLLWNARAV